MQLVSKYACNIFTCSIHWCKKVQSISTLCKFLKLPDKRQSVAWFLKLVSRDVISQAITDLGEICCVALIFREEKLARNASVRATCNNVSARQLNPSRPNSDLSQTSHCNIKGLSDGEVMRIVLLVHSLHFHNGLNLCDLQPYLCTSILLCRVQVVP